MRRYISWWSVVAIAVMIHVDWHLGRGHHHRLSLSWPYHWITGWITFLLLALFCARKWPATPFRTALLNGVLGLFAGQIVEPLLEALGYRTPVGMIFSPERWHVFGQFAIAAVVGLLAGFAVGAARRDRRGAASA
jgi:hypothetical protein